MGKFAVMKILHLPNSFLPWTNGGTEVYVYALSKALKQLGIENSVCIHQKNQNKLGQYDYNGIPIMVISPIPNERDRLSVYNRQYDQIPGFEEFLDQNEPDIVHFHDLSGGASLSHLKIVKQKKIPAILTYHSPGQSCGQRALRYGNKTICDGKLDLERCTTCAYINKGLPKYFSYLSKIFGTDTPIKNDASNIKRIVTVPSATKIFIESFLESIDLFDKVHVHARWVEQLFLINNIPPSKLYFARTAYPNIKERTIIEHQNIDNNTLRMFTKKDPLKVVYLGRCDFVKGVHILIEAAEQVSEEANIEFYFFGPYWDSEYARALLGKMAMSDRFKKPSLLFPEEVITQLRPMDIMVVPSLWPETGPLSLLEGLEAGLPIIGSNMGGIPEWIQDGQNGLLFEYGNSLKLKEKLEWILEDPKRLLTLKNNVHLDRTMNDLGLEIKSLYLQLLNSF